MIHKINKLVTRAQARALKRAARILTYGDKHDAVFYDECRKIAFTNPELGLVVTPYTVQIGQDYKLVRAKVPVQTNAARIIEANANKEEQANV